MRSFLLNGTLLDDYFRNFTGGVVRVRNGRVEIFADDSPAERVSQPTKAEARSEVATPGPDGNHVAVLLSHAERDGAAILTSIATKAIQRLLRGDPMKAVGATHLFTPNEMAAIAEALASSNATANLLGRARVRLRQQRAEEAREQWDEHEPTRFAEAFGPAKFADKPGTPAPVKPLAPLRAIAWFKRRVPTVRVNVSQFNQEQRDKAFWLARQTDKTVLEKVKEIILQVLATGKGTSEAPHLIKTVLDKTGLAPANPQYPAMIARTALMSSYNAGQQEELNDPDTRAMFPIWRYDGIDDGREGKDHLPHFGQFYPASVPFEKIRNMYVVRRGQVVPDATGRGRVFNCRCTATLISRYKWQALKNRGAAIAVGFEDPTEIETVMPSEDIPTIQPVQFAEADDDLVSCGVSPKLAESLSVPESGEVTRDVFHYREAADIATRCANCVLPGMRIDGLYDVGSKAWYSGQAVKIRTASGQNLSLTINHPVLTENGFIPAGHIEKGDHLLGYRRDVKRGKTSSQNYVQHAPLMIEEVFDAIAARSFSVAVEVPAVFDFHGDGQFVQGNVNIVRSDRLLRIGTRDAHSSETLDQLSLATANAVQCSMPRCGNGALNIKWHLSSPGCRIGFSNDRSAFINSQLGIPFCCSQLDGLASGSHDDPSICESLNDVVKVAVEPLHQTESAGASNVFLDDVIAIHRFSYEGIVYNLESPTGLIVAENIYISNCKHYQPDIPDRLGKCGLFECLPQRDKRFNLLPDVGNHMVCRAFEAAATNHAEAQEKDADYLRDQAKQFWANRERQEANAFAEKSMAESMGPAMHRLADVIERHHQPPLAPVVNVAAPVVNVPAPVVNVAAPEVKVAAPVVHVSPPVVNVQPPKVEVNVEAAKAPDVRVEVKPPKVPQPKVTVQPKIVVNPKVEMPKRTTTKEVTYDSDGNVKRVTEREE